MTTPPEPPGGDPWQNAPGMSPEQSSQPWSGGPPPPPGPPGYGQPPGYGGPPPPPGFGQPPGYGQQPPPYGSGPPGWGPPRPQSNGMGIAALILGIVSIPLGFALIGGLLGAVAVILGVMGRGKAKRGEASNGGVALTGVILGAIGILISLFVVLFAVAIAPEIGDLVECTEAAQSEEERLECERRFDEQVEQ